MSTQPKLTRRQFLKTAGAAAAGAALAACAPQAVSPTAVPPTIAKVLKTVRFVMSGKATSADTADPAFNNTSHDGRLISAVYEQLAQFDESLKAVPVLAESWEPNETGSEWTVKLRQGVTFHNGDKFTAQDVVYSYRRMLDPDVASPGAGNLSSLDPDGIEAVDDSTVRFTLTQPNVDFPLSTVFRQAYIVPDGASGDDLKTTVNGTGPFKLQKFTPGETPTLFVKNENYWQAGFPRADALELTSISETASRVAALQAGQVDIIEDPPFTDLESLRAGADTAIVVQPKGNMELIAMQIDQPPFDDLRVRQAMKYAMDRQGMLDLVAQGFGTLVNDIPIHSSLEYGVPGVREHDVARARQLLSEAGYPDGLTVTLNVSDVQARFVEFATVYQQFAAEAGITVELNLGPADTYWDVVWLKEPMYVSAYIARPTDGMLALLYLSTADWNETHWRQEDWDQLFARARATLDYDQRKALYQQAQQSIMDEGGHLVPYMVSTINATRKNITGWLPSGTPYHDFRPIDVAG